METAGCLGLLRSISADVRSSDDNASHRVLRYEWQQNWWMPGTSPDYLPSRQGFRVAVAKMAARGVQVLPYIDPHLIDRNASSWGSANVAGATCLASKQRFGAGAAERYAYEERWGTEHRALSQQLVAGPSFSVIANPGNPVWQRTVGELVGKLVREEGTAGAYVMALPLSLPACYLVCFGTPE